MSPRTRILAVLAGTALALALPHRAHAERVRFHYGPDAFPGGTLAWGGGALAGGERISLFGGTEPYTCPLVPTKMVTVQHFYTGQLVCIPMRLPDDVPLIQRRYNSTILNYGSYTVEVHFSPDGSLDVIYNSGPFRPVAACVISHP
jgi:hypothetical protein